MSHEINLYDESLRAVWDPFSLQALLIIVAVSGGLIVAGHLFAREQMSAARSAAEAGEARVVAMRAKLVENARALSERSSGVKLQQQLEAHQSDLQRLQRLASEISDVLRDQARPFADVFRSLARRDTEGVWLTDIEISRGARLSRLHGLATHEALIPQYISGLRQEPALAGLSFAHLVMGPPRTEGLSDSPAQPSGEARSFVLSSESPRATAASLAGVSR
jgi:hypothetical protein